MKKSVACCPNGFSKKNSRVLDDFSHSGLRHALNLWREDGDRFIIPRDIPASRAGEKLYTVMRREAETAGVSNVEVTDMATYNALTVIWSIATYVLRNHIPRVAVVVSAPEVLLYFKAICKGVAKCLGEWNYEVVAPEDAPKANRKTTWLYKTAWLITEFAALTCFSFSFYSAVRNWRDSHRLSKPFVGTLAR